MSVKGEKSGKERLQDGRTERKRERGKQRRRKRVAKKLIQAVTIFVYFSEKANKVSPIKL